MQRCQTGTLPPIFNCQCTMHSILSHLNENEQNSACTHIRFFLEHIEPNYSYLFGDAGDVIKKIQPLGKPCLAP